MKYFCKVVSFLPDNESYTLSPLSDAGWYTLYPPVERVSSNTPALIYFDPASPNYLGWTTTVPIGCLGNQNYHLGKCELIYQRLEDSRILQKDENRGNSTVPLGKGIIPVVGRMLDKRVSFILPEVEIFCLHARYEECLHYNKLNPPILPSSFPGWSVGMITYSKSLGGAIVPETIFGQYVKAEIRDLGRLETYTESLIPHTVSPFSSELPIVSNGQPLEISDWLYVGQTLIFNNMTVPADIRIDFPETIYGSIPNSTGRALTIQDESIIVKGSETSFSVDLSNLSFLNSVSNFNLLIGNQKFTQVF